MSDKAQTVVEEPIPMILFCPAPDCHKRHIDGPHMDAHRTHACQFCGFAWMPSLAKTVGVQFLPGCKDTP